MCARKAEQGIHSLHPIVFNHLQESRAPSHITVIWEDKTPSLRMSLPSFFFPHFYPWAWCRMVWKITLVSWGQLSWLCPLPAPCAPPAHSLVGRWEEQNKPGLCVSTAQQ